MQLQAKSALVMGVPKTDDNPRPSSRRNRPLARVIVKSAPGFPTEPAGFDVLHEQWTWPVFGIGKAIVESMHDAEAGIEADKVSEFEWPHGMMRAEPHRRIYAFDRAYALVERVNRLRELP